MQKETETGNNDGWEMINF